MRVQLPKRKVILVAVVAAVLVAGAGLWYYPRYQKQQVSKAITDATNAIQSGNSAAAEASIKKQVGAAKGEQKYNALSILAAAQLNQSKYTEALTTYQQILAIKPDDVPALTGQANALMSLGLKKQAIAVYERLITVLQSSEDDQDRSYVDYYRQVVKSLESTQ
jgi:tetratricopeptide (TPR) repeat protein